MPASLRTTPAPEAAILAPHELNLAAPLPEQLKPPSVPCFSTTLPPGAWGQPSFDDGDAPLPTFKRAHRPRGFRPAICCECDDHAIEGEAFCADCFARENAKPVAGETEEQAAERHAARMAVVREGELS